ncbi:M15 family metallopeptidase [Nocardia sp. AG03]|uniref:M15 family metallopeptidase n=1 Tax=Nocardia sp. AG03 TaxID=3025312 RepID=UPI0024189639|nr:M15 family metallopeptidase [Nocardia sp. AG03]
MKPHPPAQIGRRRWAIAVAVLALGAATTAIVADRMPDTLAFHKAPFVDFPLDAPDTPVASVFTDDLPTVANLDPDLLAALRQAATDARADGIDLVVTSGWRTAADQRQLLRDAIAKYGSEAEAARWVATPDRSAHVSGDAVDLGLAEATTWLSRHGAAYGLCQTYVNEPWHYELRPSAVDEGCPDPYADPTEDPRMRW